MKWNEDGKITCRNCQRRPASYKRLKLCTICTGQLRRANRIPSKANYIGSTHTVQKYEHHCEVVFGQAHPSFIYEPAVFHVDGEKYTPDFYDPIQNVFYEVIGTRQRFSQLKLKLVAFRRLFPNIALEICSQDGSSYSTKDSESTQLI